MQHSRAYFRMILWEISRTKQPKNKIGGSERDMEGKLKSMSAKYKSKVRMKILEREKEITD